MQVEGPGAATVIESPFPDGSGAFTYPEIFVNEDGDIAMAYERLQSGVFDPLEFTLKHAKRMSSFPQSTAAFNTPLASSDNLYFFAGSRYA